MQIGLEFVKCPNCGREIAVIYEKKQYECPRCGQRFGIRNYKKVPQITL